MHQKNQKRSIISQWISFFSALYEFVTYINAVNDWTTDGATLPRNIKITIIIDIANLFLLKFSFLGL
ncbi:hypothetical protein C797_21296 [Bacillus thuringiensis Sbt003]|uniref:Uncharacterized protein n=1 Tax=Bacillus thuringiensis Sbt003 TaxID=1235825 RepID=A0A9X0F640_BACTU|nr:hypothetical protein C797_21296 [Bacillus thuringiensis Sbt003]